MTFDLEDNDAPAEWQTDICLIGGGIAGLTLAHALRAYRGEITLLESGGREFEERSQAFNEVEFAASRHAGSMEGRFRVLGGSSTRWGGQLLPYESEVFAARPWRGQAAWPIAPEEIYRHRPEVLRFMGLEELPFDDALPAVLGLAETRPVPPAGVRVRYSQWARFSERNLAHKPQLDRATLKTFLHANAVSLESTGSGAIDSVLCRSLTGRVLRVRARYFVLALGTIENCRLLLASPHGIGNAQGLVGVGFHDHLSVAAGEIPEPAAWARYLAPYFHRGILHTAKLEATPANVEEHGWLDAMAHFEFVTEGTALAGVRDALQMRQEGKSPAGALLRLLGDPWGLLDLARVGWAAKIQRRRVLPRGGRLRLRIDTEQTATSRISLGETRDALGLLRARLDWRVSASELATVRGYQRYLQANWPAAWGPVAWEPEPGSTANFADTYHMMGGTPMGTDPMKSVVGPDLRVHGAANLYIAGCSTFPNGGSSNPTFTLMCLCFRLAEVLAKGEAVAAFKSAP